MEFDRYFFTALNYQSLLNINASTADALAEKNMKFVEQTSKAFEARLTSLISHFCQVDELPDNQMMLTGWPEVTANIKLTRERFGDVIIALFHFGKHRDILVDMAFCNIPFVAPIAGHAFWNFYQQRDLLPLEFSGCFNLLNVESPTVGRDLIRKRKEGKVIALYADGNMGPDGVHVKEGGEIVKFFNRDVSVKAGIARLSAKLNAPVLPLYSYLQVGKDQPEEIVSGSLLMPGIGLMQQLYSQFESLISLQPQRWEFITCLHRWLGKVDTVSVSFIEDYNDGQLFHIDKINTKWIKNNNAYMVFDLAKQKAIEFPAWATKYVDQLLDTEPPVSLENLRIKCANDEKCLVLLHELLRRKLLVQFD